MTAPRLAPLAPLAAALALVACDSGVQTVVLNDEPATEAAPADAFALYSLGRAAEGPDSVDVRLTIERVGLDSAETTAWDIGFRGADVILNSGASGPGAAIGAVVETPFSNVAYADSLGPDRLGVPFRRDGESACAEGPARVVCPPGDSPFALFRDAADGPEPIPSRTLVLRLADAAGFAKLEVLGYDAEAETVTLRYLTNPIGADLRDGAMVEVDL
jgi:hypothetical protein